MPVSGLYHSSNRSLTKRRKWASERDNSRARRAD